jgi:hypothetical protein
MFQTLRLSACVRLNPLFGGNDWRTTGAHRSRILCSQMKLSLCAITILVVAPILVACGTQTVTSTTTVTVAETRPAPEASGSLSARVRRWKGLWCAVKLTMNRDEILRVMGKPNFISAVDSDHWGGYGWLFSADYDLHDRPYSLQWNAPRQETLACLPSRRA